MKRRGNLYTDICSVENLMLADANARKGKKQEGIIKFDANYGAEIQALHEELANKTYKISPYYIFKIHEPKERIIYRLPYRDRVVQHAIMNILERIFVTTFTADTYSCIKGKGIHAMASGIKRALRDKENTQYCLKLDIRKFYPSVDHDILKALLRRKIKDTDLLWLLDEIIDSADGLPIGNYLSQYLANFYLTYFDHWLKEVKGVKYYFRYADDIVIFGKTKAELHELRKDIANYLCDNLKLEVKGNYQVFPTKEGVDVVGYIFYHTHTLLRKRIKQNFARLLARGTINPSAIASYIGWCRHCNSYNLLNKLLANHETIQPIRHTYGIAGVRRPKNRHGQRTGPGNRSTRLQNSSIEIQGKIRELYAPADSSGW